MGKAAKPIVFNSFEELLEILLRERRATLRKRRMYVVIVLVYLAFAVLLSVIMASHHAGSGVGGLFGAMGGLTASLFAMSQTQRAGIKALEQFDDIRMVPRLIEALDYNSTDLFSVVSGLLQQLLPRLQASDAYLLTAEHRKILNRCLNGNIFLSRDKTDNLRISILTALEQVGDASSVPVVEALAAGHGPARKHPALQQVAQECLPALRLRAQQMEQNQTLLRAADALSGAEQVLLRPAVGGNSEPREELLRSVASEQTVIQEHETVEQSTPSNSLPSMPQTSFSAPTDENVVTATVTNSA